MSASQKPLVSIVIPAYNAMPYLEEAIESILAQDYPKVELIVLDDGSTDSTKEFLEKYKGTFYFESHANMGQVKTLNKGWEMSTGEIIGYLSADDKLAPDAVSNSVSEFLKDPKIVVTYPNNALINSNSTLFRFVTNLQDYDFQKLLCEGYRICFVGAFWLKNAFNQIGGWDSNYRNVSDLDYFLRLSLMGQFKHIDKTLGYHRVHPASITSSKTTLKQANEYKELIEKTLIAHTSKISGNKNKIRGKAYLISARSHLLSGRYSVARNYFFHAIKIAPQMVLSVRFYKIVINSIVAMLQRRL